MAKKSSKKNNSNLPLVVILAVILLGLAVMFLNKPGPGPYESSAPEIRNEEDLEKAERELDKEDLEDLDTDVLGIFTEAEE